MTRPDSVRVFRGKVAAAFIRRGWRPPPLNDLQAHRLLEDMERINTAQGHAYATLKLSPMETRVLQLAADGYDAHGMAAKVGVGFETIKTQSKLARRKLGANNTTHAVAIAMREGLIA